MANWGSKPTIAASEVVANDKMPLQDSSAIPGTRDRTITIDVLAVVMAALMGGLIPAGTTAERPDAPGTGQAQLYLDTDLGDVIVHNGTGWVNLDGTSL